MLKVILPLQMSEIYNAELEVNLPYYKKGESSFL